MLTQKYKFKNIGLLLAAFLGVELLSFLALSYPSLLPIIFFLILILFLFLSIYRFKSALLILLLELIISSKGYLFYLLLNSERLLSLRIAIWAIFMLVFVIKFGKQLLKDKKNSLYWQNILNFTFLKPYLLLAGALLLGLVSALIYGNDFSAIFFDFNNWLYFLTLFPLIAIAPKRKDLVQVLFIGAIWISLKTLILLAIFSHNTFTFPVYSWLRKTLVGEMTVLSGSWNRIFIQSQSFVVVAYLFLLAKSQEFSFSLKKLKLKSSLLILAGGLFFSTIVLSLSRSFWLALLGASSILLLILFIKKNRKLIIRPLLFIVLSSLVGVALILLTLPRGSSGALDAQISERITGGSEEAALASRWSLLPPLMDAILVNPISGQGFGAMISYRSQDPRVLENNPDGIYTTYAFEWGYLDIWLKVGLIGLLAYLYLLWSLIKKTYQRAIASNDYLYYGLLSAILFLAITHFFTPYLNHPLGIGFIIVSSCLIAKNKVY